MKYRLAIVFLIIFILQKKSVHAQVTDSTAIMYQEIKDYSKKRKVTKNLHKWIFKPIRSRESNHTNRVIDSIDYTAYKGKIIRKIIFESLDPFGATVEDSLRKPRNWFEKTGNNLHVKSKPWAIKNYLMIKENTPLDPFKVKESERLLYEQRFIRNVKIYPKAIATTNDSVDLVIRSQDSWSIIPKISGSTSKFKSELIERNFIGIGHEFRAKYQQQLQTRENLYDFQYRLPNIRQTFIETRWRYLKTYNDNTLKEIQVERKFFSNYAKWAGGIHYEQFFRNDTVHNISLEKEFLKYKYNKIEIWGGYAFNILKNSPYNRVTNFVTTASYDFTDYTQFPDPNYDPYMFYNNTSLWLTSFGITSREFNKSKYIFYHGINEYIQTGRNAFVTTGWENRNHVNRFYLGGRMSFGQFNKFGYLASFFDIGTFYNRGKTEQNLVRLSAFYMSPIFNIKNWNVRQFVVPKFSIGGNRFPVWDDLTSLSEHEDGIKGFTNQMRGSKKLLITLQTQSYVPKSIWGFRLSPFFNANFGLLGNTTKKLFNSKLYSSFGIGVQISNDYLIFDNFQFSFMYFPTTPLNGNNVFTTNSLNSDDIQLPDFQIGKPEIVKYF